jgi:hypothetical protein
VGINQNAKNTLSVYPNPSSNVIYVDGLNINTTATIVDLQGKLIKSVDENAHPLMTRNKIKYFFIELHNVIPIYIFPEKSIYFSGFYLN